MPIIERCALCEKDSFTDIERFPTHLVICKSCGLIFIKDREDEGFYQELYAKKYSYGQRNSGEQNKVKRKIQGQLRWILKYVPKSGISRILEVGCSYGDLLRGLKSACRDVYGIEPSMQAAQEAKKQLGSSYLYRARVSARLEICARIIRCHYRYSDVRAFQ